MKRIVLVALSLCAGLLLAPAQSKFSAYFLAKLGNDTVAVEGYTMGPHELTGTSIVRNPQTVIRTYSATYGADGKLEELRISFAPYGKGVAAERSYLYTDDSVQIMVRQDTMTRRMWSPVAGRPMPFLADLFGGWNEAVRQAVNSTNPEFSIFAGNKILHYIVQKTGPGTIDLVNAEDSFGPMHVTVRPDGQFDRFDMTATTDKFIVERVPTLNLDAIGASFAARESKKGAMGVLSPRDTVKTTIQGAHVLIDYGRPSARGRSIFGNVVPWDQVWRTGANAATQLVTDRELIFGSYVVPPGTYSLFTLPGKNGWMLIVNKQHGQWGTVYDPAKDLVRIPLTTTPLPEHVEQFRFDLQPTAGGGTLQYSWERTRASASFTVH